MHPNAEAINRFFRCYASGDFHGMQECIHPDIEFSDIGFDLRGKKQVAAMTRTHQDPRRLECKQHHP